MRDAFLIFLLVIAVIVVAGYITCLVMTLRSGEGDGCLSGCLLLVTGWFVVMLVAGILAVVGHAVGVNMSSLTGG